MKHILFFALIFTIFLGSGCLSQVEPEQILQEIDRSAILFEAQKNGLIMTEEQKSAMASAEVLIIADKRITDAQAYLDGELSGWQTAALADVTGGSSFGLAYSRFERETFTFLSKIGGLPVPAQGYGYEGWLVKQDDPLSVVSLGSFALGTEWHTHAFVSSMDLSSYDFFVLTLEPEDGNPQPSEHILEGRLK